jgi:putative ABC transport system ATP-binding protein
MLKLVKNILVQIHRATKSYTLDKTQVNALREVSLEVESGEFLALSGASGSGKTTLLNLIGAIDKPTTGDVIIDGVNLSRLSAEKLAEFRCKKIGFIFQTFNLIPTLSVFENVEYPLVLLGVSKEQRRKHVEQWLEVVGLKDKMKHTPSELSGGQRQRVAIARALVKKPSIVLADEPTANLDKKTATEILDLLQTINETRNITFIFSTHDLLVLQRVKRIFRLDEEVEKQAAVDENIFKVAA